MRYLIDNRLFILRSFAKAHLEIMCEDYLIKQFEKELNYKYEFKFKDKLYDYADVWAMLDADGFNKAVNAYIKNEIELAITEAENKPDSVVYIGDTEMRTEQIWVFI